MNSLIIGGFVVLGEFLVPLGFNVFIQFRGGSKGFSPDPPSDTPQATPSESPKARARRSGFIGPDVKLIVMNYLAGLLWLYLLMPQFTALHLRLTEKEPDLPIYVLMWIMTGQWFVFAAVCLLAKWMQSFLPKKELWGIAAKADLAHVLWGLAWVPGFIILGLLFGAALYHSFENMGTAATLLTLVVVIGAFDAIRYVVTCLFAQTGTRGPEMVSAGNRTN